MLGWIRPAQGQTGVVQGWFRATGSTGVHQGGTELDPKSDPRQDPAYRPQNYRIIEN